MKSFYLNIDKCKFLIIEVIYLEMYVRKNKIKMNLKNVQVILKLKIIKSTQDILLFLNFQTFMYNLSKSFLKKLNIL